MFRPVSHQVVIPYLFPNGRWGHVNQHGDTITRGIYEHETEYRQTKQNNQSESRSAASITLPDGWNISDQRANLVVVVHKDRFGLVDDTGRVLIEPKFRSLSICDYETAIAETEQGVGIITSSNKVLVDFVWDAIAIADGDRFTVRRAQKKGLISRNGTVLAKPIWTNLKPMGNGLFIVELNGKFGLLNTPEQLILEPTWNDIVASSAGLLKIRKDGKWGLFDLEKRKFIAEPIWDDCISHRSKHDLIGVEQNRKHGLINSDGKIVVPVIYDHRLFPSEKDGLMHAQLNGKDGLIKLDGTIVSPFTWDELELVDDSSELLLAERDKKSGYLDRAGKTVIPLQYDEAYSFRTFGDCVIVKANGKATLINKQGKELFPTTWDELSHFPPAFLKARRNGQWGVIDKQGKVLVEPAWDDINHYGKNSFLVEQKGNFGVIDSAGNILVEPTWDIAYEMSNNHLNSINLLGSVDIIGETSSHTIAAKAFTKGTSNEYWKILQKGNNYLAVDNELGGKPDGTGHPEHERVTKQPTVNDFIIVPIELNQLKHRLSPIQQAWRNTPVWLRRLLDKRDSVRFVDCLLIRRDGVIIRTGSDARDGYPRLGILFGSLLCFAWLISRKPWQRRESVG